MPKLSEWLFGKKDKIKQAKTLDPMQEQLKELISQGLISGEGPFADIFGGFNKQAFEEGVTKPALQNFQENILPQIQEKFIAGNQVLGSGMRRGQLKAATDLQSQLSQLMYQAQQDALKNKLLGINQHLGTKSFENIYKQGTTGAIPAFIQGIAGRAGEGAGSSIANFFSGNNGGSSTPAVGDKAAMAARAAAIAG